MPRIADSSRSHGVRRDRWSTTYIVYSVADDLRLYACYAGSSCLMYPTLVLLSAMRLRAHRHAYVDTSCISMPRGTV